MRTNYVPVYAAGIAVDDVPRTAEGEGWDADIGELGGELAVHLMLCQSEGERCHLLCEVVYLNAVELGELDVDKRKFVVSAQFCDAFPYLNLQLAKFLIGNDEEVAATAGWVEELHLGDADKQLAEFLHVVLCAGVCFVKVVEEERLDNLHDVRNGSVVHS